MSEPSQALGWQGNEIDWEVTRVGKYLLAEGWYRDKHIANVRARWPLTLQLWMRLASWVHRWEVR